MKILYSTLDSYRPPEARVSRSDFVRLSVWFTLALCLIAVILPLLTGRSGVWSRLDLVGLWSWQTLLGGVLGAISGIGVGTLILHWRPLQVIAQRLRRLIAWETFRRSDYVLVAFLAAWGEELLFRGALQPLIGLVPTAVIFGLLHATSGVHIFLAGILGLALGWLFHWSGSLWSPIAAHLMVDLGTGWVMARTLTLKPLSLQGD